MRTMLGERIPGGWVFLLVAVLVALSFEPCPAEDPEWANDIDRLVQPYLDESIVVGLVVTAVRGEDTLVRGYGRVVPDEPTRPTGQTIYEIGSVTKTMTGLSLADAVVDGRLQLNDTVADLLPDDVRMPVHPDGPIRLKHLATHASGLPRLPANLAPADPRDPYADYAATDLYAFLGRHSLAHAPETELEYSNLGFGLLGQILADHADSSYGELIRSSVAKPLKMEHTAVELNEVMRARLAPPYNADLTEDRNWRFQAMAGAGAVRSTGEDMLQYVRAHLHPPEGSLGEAIELAWRIHQPGMKGDGFAMGLGWHIARDGETRWHNGQTGGYHSMVLINRPGDAAVVVLANTATMEMDVLAEQLLRMLLGAREEPRKFEKAVDVSRDQMQRLVGRYQLGPGFVLTVKIEDEQLMVALTGQDFYRVFPQSDAEWKYRVVNASLTFEFEEEGPAKAVVLHQNGLDQRAPRAE